MRFFLKFSLIKIPRINIRSYIYTSISSVDHIRINLNDLPNINGLEKTNPTDINNYTISFSSVSGTGVSRLVNPFHHNPAVYFSAKIYISGFAYELE